MLVEKFVFKLIDNEKSEICYHIVTLYDHTQMHENWKITKDDEEEEGLTDREKNAIVMRAKHYKSLWKLVHDALKDKLGEYKLLSKKMVGMHKFVNIDKSGSGKELKSMYSYNKNIITKCKGEMKHISEIVSYKKKREFYVWKVVKIDGKLKPENITDYKISGEEEKEGEEKGEKKWKWKEGKEGDKGGYNKYLNFHGGWSKNHGKGGYMDDDDEDEDEGMDGGKWEAKYNKYKAKYLELKRKM